MIESIINCSDLTAADAIILSAPYGRSFTYRSGAEHGPSAIVRCLNGNLEFYDRLLCVEPLRHISICHHELQDLNLLEPAAMVQRIMSFSLAHQSKFLLMLGGDHSVSIGRFAALAEAYNPRDITILQIDAHPDLRDHTGDYQERPESLSHACTMRRAADLGLQICQVGIRTYSVFEYEFMLKNKVTVFEWGRGNTPSISSIVASIRTPHVYLTIDADGIDPSHMPAVGTPVPGGLEWYYARNLIKAIIAEHHVVGADIVEVSPFPHDVVTEYAAAQLCYDIVACTLLKGHICNNLSPTPLPNLGH